MHLWQPCIPVTLEASQLLIVLVPPNGARFDEQRNLEGFQWTDKYPSRLNNVHLHDQLSDQGGGDLPSEITYVSGTFELWSARVRKNSGTATLAAIPLGSMLISPDGKSFLILIF